MSVMSVAAASEEMGVSARRVRQMLAEGELIGERIGRAWVVDHDAVRNSRLRRRGAGRPWSSASAWAVLSLADGMDSELEPFERSRAKKRLELGLRELRRKLAARAESQRMYAHPAILGRIAAHPDVVRSGISAAADHNADLVATDAFEGYVRSSQVAGLVNEFGLDGDAERPNVVLHVVDDSVWPFPEDQHIAGSAVVAIDLLDAADPRSRCAGHELLNRS